MQASGAAPVGAEEALRADAVAAGLDIEVDDGATRCVRSGNNGVLQTEDYARAVIRGVLSTASTREVEQRVQARIERQAVLSGEDPLLLWVIIDEAALRRMNGGPEVMREQLNHLLAAAAEPHVTLQVIPFGVGSHPGMLGSFVLMNFPDVDDPEIVYIDSMAGDLFLEAEADVRRYSSIFDNLRAVALSPNDSASLIAASVKDIP